MTGLPWNYNDGGRASAGFKGNTDDCVVRAITLGTGRDYRDVYDDLFAEQRHWLETSRTRYARRVRNSGKIGDYASPRNGVRREVYEPYLASCGWRWVPTMQIGQGTTVHLAIGELPMLTAWQEPDVLLPIIARCSKHVVAVVDGIAQDTSDPTRNGTRAVYGFFIENVDHPRLTEFTG